MTFKIVVLGSGVSGLTSALQLKRDNPEYDVTVIGRHIPGDWDPEYTSPFAGANWASFSEPGDIRQQQFDAVAYPEFKRLAAEDPQAGVWAIPNTHYYTAEGLRKKGHRAVPWYKDLTNLRELPKSELPEGIEFGTTYDGVVISTQVYLQYLSQKLLGLGVPVLRVPTLQSVDDARKYHHSGQPADLVVNALGLLVSKLAGFDDDKENYPVRGQVLIVRNTSKQKLSVSGFEGYPEDAFYLMPRKEGGAIIGGCFSRNTRDGKEDPELTKRIIERALKYAPDLVDPSYKNNPTEIEIVRVGVGMRPFRESGPRVEADPAKPWLVHNYGAGAGGYQGSYGFANKVVEIVRTKVKARL